MIHSSDDTHQTFSRFFSSLDVADVIEIVSALSADPAEKSIFPIEVDLVGCDNCFLATKFRRSRLEYLLEKIKRSINFSVFPSFTAPNGCFSFLSFCYTLPSLESFTHEEK